jgi:hypothetical protein
MPTTTSGRPDKAIPPDQPSGVRGWPVESATRVNVAFPFSTIKVMSGDLPDGIHELAALVAALAAEVQTLHPTTATEDLAARTQALTERLDQRGAGAQG